MKEHDLNVLNRKLYTTIRLSGEIPESTFRSTLFPPAMNLWRKSVIPDFIQEITNILFI